MLRSATAILCFLFICSSNFSWTQCSDCGNGIVDAGETNLNCPQDVPHDPTCVSPCSQPGSFETVPGIRLSYDFVGTTAWSSAGLPGGWAFASAPSPTTAGTLGAAGTDAYGAKAGLIQPNCSGGCTGTNGFCIGNLASTSSVFSGGSGGKLGANFDGRPNVSSNISYAVLRGTGNPTLVSPTYNMSAVDGFKIQFWLFPSETSCGQLNSWGSCVGNTAYLDFSSNGGVSWTQIMKMDLSSSSSDMCFNNSTNTQWIRESAWSRVCLTVFRGSSVTGNFYTAASTNTAPSGIMVNSTYFTSSFKFRIRYAQTASCSSGITATNPGRYLAIDYPVVTSGNEMIPCGISFANMCGYGADANDDLVGSAISTSTTTVFGTVRRGVNQAERGVEIFTSQNASYAMQNTSGSSFTTNYDLCNAEGGDRQCIDWENNNNFYSVVYECIADWEAPSGTGINVQYYKGTSPQSFGLTKVTTVGKTAAIGWRYSGSRFVSCGTTSDLNPGCNGYSFLSGSLPTQFARGFYGLAINNLGQAWSYYGASSCSNYFNGPYLTPIAKPDTITGVGNYVTCVSGSLFFTGLVDVCQTGSGLSGSSSIVVTGPGGFSEIIPSGGVGSTPITLPGDYFVVAEGPTTPVQCTDCSRSVCVTITTTDINDCAMPLPVELVHWTAIADQGIVRLQWATFNEHGNEGFELERSGDGVNFEQIGFMNGFGGTNEMMNYEWIDEEPLHGKSYYRLVQVDVDGQRNYSPVVSCEWKEGDLILAPNPASESVSISIPGKGQLIVYNGLGAKIYESKLDQASEIQLDLSQYRDGVYVIEFQSTFSVQKQRLLVNR